VALDGNIELGYMRSEAEQRRVVEEQELLA
jgi:hypothetical protein